MSHYETADGYFGAAEGLTEGKIAAFAELFDRATELTGGCGRVLDVGCGRGESLVAARDAGWAGIGVDPTERFVAHGRDVFGVDVRVGLLDAVDEPPASFDLVLFSGVLEHSYEPVGLLRGAHKLLAPGGLVYVDVPNESSAYARLGRAAQRMRGHDWALALSPTFAPYHVVGFSQRALRVAFEHAGFSLVSLDYYPLMLATPMGLTGGRAS